MSYALTVVTGRPYDDAVAATRAALAEQGFGVLTEIDIKATLKQKLDVDVPAQVILGACRPPLAHQALQTEPGIGLLLPCNVVVREDSDGRVVVAAVDPQSMIEVTGNPELAPVADEASTRLRAALATLED